MQLFFCEFCDIFKNISFAECLRMTAFDTSTNNQISKMKQTKQKQKINISSVYDSLIWNKTKAIHKILTKLQVWWTSKQFIFVTPLQPPTSLAKFIWTHPSRHKTSFERCLYDAV